MADRQFLAFFARKIKLQNSNPKLQINSKIPGPDRKAGRTRAGQVSIIETNRFEFRLFEFGVCLLFGACYL